MSTRTSATFALPATSAIVIHQDAVRRPVEVVELTAPQRIPENPADQERENQTDRHQQKDDIDGRYSKRGCVELTGFKSVGDALRNNLSAFAMTSAELAAMPRPAKRFRPKLKAAKVKQLHDGWLAAVKRVLDNNNNQYTIKNYKNGKIIK